jgi:hypothetical protein
MFKNRMRPLAAVVNEFLNRFKNSSRATQNDLLSLTI